MYTTWTKKPQRHDRTSYLTQLTPHRFPHLSTGIEFTQPLHGRHMLHGHNYQLSFHPSYFRGSPPLSARISVYCDPSSLVWASLYGKSWLGLDSWWRPRGLRRSFLSPFALDGQVSRYIYSNSVSSNEPIICAPWNVRWCFAFTRCKDTCCCQMCSLIQSFRSSDPRLCPLSQVPMSTEKKVRLKFLVSLATDLFFSEAGLRPFRHGLLRFYR